MSELNRPVLTPPDGEKKVLLHSCCAPCSGEVMEAITAVRRRLHHLLLQSEHSSRARVRAAQAREHPLRRASMALPFVDADYDTDNWFARASGMENEPERGVRCTMCFDMRFVRTALYAHEHGFSVIS
jgi:predicted adenine nucleotide alpha hydrolase (AANH) superfamily ATPase